MPTGSRVTPGSAAHPEAGGRHATLIQVDVKVVRALLWCARLCDVHLQLHQLLQHGAEEAEVCRFPRLRLPWFVLGRPVNVRRGFVARSLCVHVLNWAGSHVTCMECVQDSKPGRSESGEVPHQVVQASRVEGQHIANKQRSRGT